MKAPSSPTSKAQLWTGRALTSVAGLFMLFDSVFKMIQPTPKPVTDSFVLLGFDPAVAPLIGGIALACTALYLFPRTAVLGAVLLTGYFGGAITSHLRLNQPLFSHVLFPVYVAVLVWGGLFLRDRALRSLFIRPSNHTDADATVQRRTGVAAA